MILLKVYHNIFFCGRRYVHFLNPDVIQEKSVDGNCLRMFVVILLFVYS